MDAFALMKKASRSPPKASPPATKRKKNNPRGALSDEQKKLIKDTLTVPYEKMTHREEFEDYYRNTLAPFLLNGVELVANGQSFLIKEVEFYFTCDAHPDPFTHCQTIQESCAVWYFHRTGNSYKSGTYKGLDVAIGRGPHAPGGILIRTLECLSTGKIICGPCNSVDHLLKTCDAPTIQHLVSEIMRDDISVCGSANNILYLYPLDTPRSDPIIHTGRVGLYMTKGPSVPVEKQAEYVFRNYRSVAEAPKVSKGRHLMGLALCREGKNAAQISAATGIKESVIQRYITAYKEGHKMAKDLSVYAGKRISDSVACEAYGAIVAHEESLAKEDGEKEDDNSTAEEAEEEEPLELSGVEEDDEEEAETTVEEPLAPRMVSVDASHLIPWIRRRVQHAIFESLAGLKKGTRKSVVSVEVSLHPFPTELSSALFKEAMEKATASSTTAYEVSTYGVSGDSVVESHKEQQHEIPVGGLSELLGAQWHELSHAPLGKTLLVQSPVQLSLSDSQPEGRCVLSFQVKLQAKK